MDLVFNIEKRGNYTLLNVQGKLTGATIGELRKAADNITNQGVIHLAFNLIGASVVDSSAIGLFIHFHKLMQAKHGGIYLVSVPPRIYSVFETSRILQAIPHYKDIASADNNIGIDIGKEERGMYFLIRPPRIFKVSSLAYVKSAIEEALTIGHNNIAFDMGKISVMDSSAIGLILNLQKRLQSEGGSVSLIGISSDIYPTLETTNILQLIPQYDDVEEADERIV